MKKTTIIMLMAAMAGISVSCTQKSKPTEFAVHAINDNEKPQTMPASIFTGAAASLAQVLGLEEGIPASMNAILIEKEGEQILFDTGNGRENSQLLPKLEALGFAPEDIDLIFITHMHGDHIGGLVKDGKAVFENAKLYINTKELDAKHLNLLCSFAEIVRKTHLSVPVFLKIIMQECFMRKWEAR